MSPTGPEELALHLIDLRDHPGSPLLGDAYERLFVPAFPAPEEREGLTSWEASLWWGEPPGRRLHVVLAVLGGGDGTLGMPVGLIVHELLPASRCGLLDWLAVAPAWQGRGIARQLVRRAIGDLRHDARPYRLQAVFGEVHDPARSGDLDDSLSPATRLQVMDRLGARLVPVPYVQPPLHPGARRGYRLFLVAFPVEDAPLRSLPTSVVERFLVELYQAADVPEAACDPDVEAVRRALGSGEELSLHPLPLTQR